MKTFEWAGAAKYSWKGKKLDSKEETVKCVACLYAARQRLSLRLASEKLEISRQKNTWNSLQKLVKENLQSENNFKAHGASEEDLLILQYKPPRKKE